MFPDTCQQVSMKYVVLIFCNCIWIWGTVDKSKENMVCVEKYLHLIKIKWEIFLKIYVDTYSNVLQIIIGVENDQ